MSLEDAPRRVWSPIGIDPVAPLRDAMLRQRGSLVEWVPVCLAVGIGLYFALLFEPSILALWAMGGAACACLLVSRWWGEAFGPFAICVAMVLIGVVLAGARAHTVAGPVLSFRYYGPIEGRVVALDRSASDAVRVTLDQVRLDDVVPWRTPVRVRLSLHGPEALTPRPGQRVMTTGHLSPPSGAVEPGGFDFQRHAWFARLGGVGYTRVPLVLAAPAEGGLDLAVFRLRMALAAHVRSVLPGDVGGFAAAVTTGDRSGISQQALDNLRASNTAHLLAISGLHMGLLTGFVFALLRVCLVLVPYTALHWPTRSIAAVGALVVASVYLALSGGNVATERAFIMVAVALVAILIHRRAISLRAVAVAAIIVLVLRPEALLSPGFQMSFAATTALVAVFGWIRDAEFTLGPRWVQGALGVVISSAVAGLATAPVGAAHFNTLASYGLIANLASVPLMGILVIPAAVGAVLLAPLGLDWMALNVMGWGLGWILGVADWAAGLPGAQRFVPGPQGFVLPVLAVGFLVLLLWRGTARWAGCVLAAAALAAWPFAERPTALIADTGALVGVMTPAGRAVSRDKGAGFVARNWLENDGDGASQAEAAARWVDHSAPGKWKRSAVAGVDIWHATGKRAAAQPPPCERGDFIVVNVVWEGPRPACQLLDAKALRQTGAVAITTDAHGVELITASEVSGARLWTSWSR